MFAANQRGSIKQPQNHDLLLVCILSDLALFQNNENNIFNKELEINFKAVRY